MMLARSRICRVRINRKVNTRGEVKIDGRNSWLLLSSAVTHVRNSTKKKEINMKEISELNLMLRLTSHTSFTSFHIYLNGYENPFNKMAWIMKIINCRWETTMYCIRLSSLDRITRTYPTARGHHSQLLN